jgi:ribosome-binding factor A
MPSSKKQGRVAERIKQILSELIQFEARDPRLSDVVVLDAEVDREVMYATVYVTAFAGEEAREEVMEALESAAGFLRSQVARRMSLRHVPELRFEWDETTAQAARIEDLLDSLDIPAETEPDAGLGNSDDAE